VLPAHLPKLQLAGVRLDLSEDFERSRDVVASEQLPARVLPFLRRIHMAYAAADLVVCRSGSMTLAEIAETSGLPARTIRFYIARGLLDGPVKGGRSAVYTGEHLARLDRIKRLQSEGRTLSEIARVLDGNPAQPAVSPPTAWWQHAIASDVIVWVRAGVSPWRMRQVRTAVDEFARQVQVAQNEPKKRRAEK